jgi:photosystem II stability/assembly factor-like uncharacterized protein
VLALATDPSNPSTVYVGTSRDLYKSVDAGANWIPARLTVNIELILTTSDPSVVYVAGGPRCWSSGPSCDYADFYRTGDGGETWVRRGRVLRPLSVTVDPRDSTLLYAASAGNLYRSATGADSWDRMAHQPGSGAGTAGIAVDPTDSAVLYAGVAYGTMAGVHRSSDRGATWNRTGLRDPTYTLLFDPRDGSRLFALTPEGLRATTSRGETWEALAPGLNDPSQLAFDPGDPDRLYVVAQGALFRSSDGGATATRVDDGSLLGRNLAAIAAPGSGVVLTGSGRGIHRTEDAGATWAPANLGIREVYPSSLAVDPTDPSVVFAASMQGLFESRDGGGSWSGPIPGSPGATVVAFDPSNRSTLYAAGIENGVSKSTDGGRQWQNNGTPTDQIADLVIDPSNSRRVLAAYRGVHRSLDGGESWETVMRPEDDYASYYYPPTVGAIAIAPSHPATVYAAGSGDTPFLYRSDDGGGHWADPIDLGRVWINALAVDSCDPTVLQAGSGAGVLRSVDGGGSWSEPQLSGIGVYAFAADPRHSSSAFAGTSVGLFWTNDRGESWTRFEPALTDPVYSVALDPSGRFLHAATARGVFSLERSFEPCADGAGRLCLMGERFEVSLTGRDPRTGVVVSGTAVTEGDRFGYFSFPALTGDSRFPEVFVKMADARELPAPYGGSVWVFHSALTDLPYTLTVRDTQTGHLRTYLEGDAVTTLICGEADTAAFARDCTAPAPPASGPGSRLASGSGPELALLDGRFRATIRAADARTGRVAEGAAIPRAEGFGYFSLPDLTGDPSFPEVFVKMTRATVSTGGYFGVFHTGLTDLEYTLTLTDTATGAIRTYPGGATDGTRLCGTGDTTAFRE